MVSGDIRSIRAPIDLDYLAPADTVLTIISSGLLFSVEFVGPVTTTLVDVSGNNTVRKVVVVVTSRELLV